MPAGKDGNMTELRQIIGVINGLNEVEALNATIGGWRVSVWEYKGERRIEFVKEIPQTEAEPEEAAIDDLPFA